METDQEVVDTLTKRVEHIKTIMEADVEFSISKIQEALQLAIPIFQVAYLQ